MYTELIKLVKRANAIGSIEEVLIWDQLVKMPKGKKAVQIRGEEMGALSAVHYNLATDEKIGELLSKIDRKKLTPEEKVNVEEIEREYERTKRLPVELVEEAAKLSVESGQAWEKAKQENDFPAFQPYLERFVEIRKAMAHAIDPNEHPYQVLFDEYEPGMKLDDVTNYFEQIRAVGVPLITAISECPVPDTSKLYTHVDESLQHAFNQKIANLLRYDLENGRLDTAVHPMTCCFGRITTRYTEGWWSAISGTIHELGHGKYEHGLPLEHFGTPLGLSHSLGTHESQSRLWENHIGLSEVFWKSHFHLITDAYAEAVNGLTYEDFIRMINKVEPGFIRVDADELTYTMHIVLRFELEKALIEGTLQAKDVPEAWNAKMQELLGITPPSDTLGCLQDVHWSEGMFAYFPTYTLGSMIATQLWNAAQRDITDLDGKIAQGNFHDLDEWLNKQVHQHGRRYSTYDLVRNATGKEMGSDDYTSYLTEKFTKLYNL